MNNKWVVFDFDGTLADTAEISYQIYLIMAERYDMRLLSREEVRELHHFPILKRLKKQGISIFQIPKLIHEFLEMYEQYLQTIPLFEGVREVIEWLKKQGIQLAIISSNRRSIIQKFLDSHDLNHFEWIQDRASIFGKARILRKALRIHNIQRNHLLYIGDEQRDVRACRKVSIPIVAVTWGYDPEVLIAKSNPDYLAKNPTQLMQHIQTWYKETNNK